MQRYRISKNAFEGLLDLQQVDAQKEAQNEVSPRTRKRLHRAQQEHERAGSAALAGAFTPLAQPATEAADHTPAGTVSGRRITFGLAEFKVIDAIRGEVVEDSLSFPKFSSMVRDIQGNRLEWPTRQEKALFRQFILPEGGLIRRVIGYLASPQGISQQEMANYIPIKADELEGRLPLTHSLSQKTNDRAAMENYIQNLYGPAKGFALLAADRKSANTATGPDEGKVLLVLKRPGPGV